MNGPESAKPVERISLPQSIVVSLKAGGIFFAVANVVCVALIVWAYLTIKLEPKTITVTGSAKKAIVSDLVTWSGTISAKDTNLVQAYNTLKASSDKVGDYLLKQGIPASEITFSAIETTRRFHQEIIPAAQAAIGAPGGPVPPTVITTDKVESYTLAQSVSLESHDMARVPGVSRSITSLIRDGVEIDSGAPRYLYTKLSELKIDMLAEATKDATMRAQQIVNNANGALEKLVEAKMGVMQINPKNVSAVSDTGNNDTTSYEKEITAIVTVRFIVK